jgi:hypothetical protein
MRNERRLISYQTSAADVEFCGVLSQHFLNDAKDRREQVKIHLMSRQMILDLQPGYAFRGTSFPSLGFWDH